MDTFSLLRVIPPPGSSEAADWESVGHALRNVTAPTEVAPQVKMYAALGQAWRKAQPGTFNPSVQFLRTELADRFPAAARRSRAEAYFNRAQPFITSLFLYVAAFLLAVVSWLIWPATLGRAAFRIMGLAYALTTAGILTRMWLEGRPPVTNLYSSALFIGWGSVGLCLILESLNANAVASAAGSLIGFGTLIIAHHLSLSGDTLEMMRAVLDSNFWLSTHVVTVTTGYASTFLAGFLAIIYIVRGLFTRSLDQRTADALARMVYGIVCFATLFSFVGTMLGGIWADQSWGRFWGWDPKENGALLIVIWNAIILHCRWGGLVRQRGLMALAVFGNVVTAWSWFGTNMLGIGLHSYGFTSAAFNGLIIFVASQSAIIGLAAAPLRKWRSFPSGTRSH
jgi:ABC-type transport system involved in cytochrome c biogenesis permease subunit